MCFPASELYLRRRRDDSVEVKQMKEQERVEKAMREAEHQRLQAEMGARLDAERKQHVNEEKLARLEKTMEQKDRELMLARERIRNLESEDGKSSTTATGE